MGTETHEKLLDELCAERVRPNKALALCAYGAAWLLTYEADDAIDTFIRDVGVSSDGFDLATDRVDFTYPGDGLWTCTLALVAAGDWPGQRECVLSVGGWVPATAEEFAAFRRRDYIWYGSDGERQVVCEKCTPCVGGGEETT